jgi:hypothetical protein
MLIWTTEDLMTAQPVLEQKIRISDDEVNDLIYMLEVSRDHQFAVGDRLIKLVKLHDGKRSEVINYLAGVLNVSASKLHEYYRVASKWSYEDREIYKSLDWTIYRNADPIEDRELLNRAIDEGWNTTTFREEKYPAIKDPKHIVERIVAIVTRNRERLGERNSKELDDIVERLNRMIAELEAHGQSS